MVDALVPAGLYIWAAVVLAQVGATPGRIAIRLVHMCILGINAQVLEVGGSLQCLSPSTV